MSTTNTVSGIYFWSLQWLVFLSKRLYGKVLWYLFTITENKLKAEKIDELFDGI